MKSCSGNLLLRLTVAKCIEMNEIAQWLDSSALISADPSDVIRNLSDCPSLAVARKLCDFSDVPEAH